MNTCPGGFAKYGDFLPSPYFRSNGESEIAEKDCYLNIHAVFAISIFGAVSSGLTCLFLIICFFLRLKGRTPWEMVAEDLVGRTITIQLIAKSFMFSYTMIKVFQGQDALILRDPAVTVSFALALAFTTLGNFSWLYVYLILLDTSVNATIPNHRKREILSAGPRITLILILVILVSTCSLIAPIFLGLSEAETFGRIHLGFQALSVLILCVFGVTTILWSKRNLLSTISNPSVPISANIITQSVHKLNHSLLILVFGALPTALLFFSASFSHTFYPDSAYFYTVINSTTVFVLPREIMNIWIYNFRRVKMPTSDPPHIPPNPIPLVHNTTINHLEAEYHVATDQKKSAFWEIVLV